MAARRDSMIYRPLNRASAGPRDPRQDNPKQFQAAARERLLNFVSHCGIRISSAISPSTNDFRTAFVAIYTVIDPSARIDTSSSKFNEDFEFIMRHVLKYPFAANISKSCIATPTGSQNWPKIISYFDWLIDLASLINNMDLAAVKEKDNTVTQEFSNRVAIYREVQENANDDDIKYNIDSTYRTKNSELVQVLHQTQRREEKLEKEIIELKGRPSPLTPLVEERDTLMRQLELDQNDLVETVHRHKLAQESLQDVKNVAKEQNELKAKLEQQLSELEARLSLQEISVDEAQRMAEQKDKLLDEQRVYEGRLRQEHDTMFSVEQLSRDAKTRAMDAAERIRESARKLGLIPTATSELARLLGVDFERLIPGHGTTDLDLLSARLAREEAHDGLIHLQSQLQKESRDRKSDLAKIEQTILELEMELSNLKKVGALLRKDKNRVDAENKDAYDEFASASKRIETETDALIEQAKRLRQSVDRSLYEMEDKVQRKRRELDDIEREYAERSAMATDELRILVDAMVNFPKTLNAKLTEFDNDMEEAVRKMEDMLRIAEVEEESASNNLAVE